MGMHQFAITVVLVAGPALAQENAPIGILRGDLVAWSGSSRTGSIVFRNAEKRLFECTFDDKTWFERENEHIAISAMRPGDHLELVADRKTPSAPCYARTVQVLDITTTRRTASGKPVFRYHNSATELFAPRGELTFAGIVTGIDGNELTIRTRDKVKHVLLLRTDTRYLGDGLPRERSSLEPQTLIFVRAGRNLDGDIEAYTIIWGDILEVRN